MISQRTQLETNVAGKDYLFQCDPQASLLDCISALDIFRFYMSGRLKDAQEQQQTQEVIPENNVEEDVKFPT